MAGAAAAAETEAEAPASVVAPPADHKKPGVSTSWICLPHAASIVAKSGDVVVVGPSDDDDDDESL